MNLAWLRHRLRENLRGLVRAFGRLICLCRLDLLTPKERAVLLFLIVAVCWGLIGAVIDRRRAPLPPASSENLYQELFQALPDLDLSFAWEEPPPAGFDLK